MLTVDESHEQTRRIHEAQRHAQTLQGILERRARPRLIRLHRNLQRLIRPLTVRNPLTKRLHFQYGRLRSRRDHQNYLALINVMALAHQYQRDLKTAHDLDGQPFHYIEVIIEDVARVNALMTEVLPRTTDELWPASRRMLAQLEIMSREQPKERWSRRQVRERTGWSDTQVRMVLGQLVDLEFVWQFGGGQGRRVFYERPSATSPPRSHFAVRGLRSWACPFSLNGKD